jgi:hypothetical protein
MTIVSTGSSSKSLSLKTMDSVQKGGLGNMKTTKGVFVFLCIAVMILATAHLAMAGRAGKYDPTIGPTIKQDSNPPGKMTVSGILGILYEHVCPQYGCGDNVVVVADSAGPCAWVPPIGCPWDLDPAPEACGLNDVLMKMTFFMRMDVSNTDWRPYGGQVTKVCYKDYDGQQDAIEDFISTKVVDDITDTPSGSPHYCFCVKSAKGRVDDEAWSWQAPLHCDPIFSLMDFQIGINKKETWVTDRSECTTPCNYVAE